METTRIQIRYSDRFGDNAGCTAVKLPEWLEQAPLPKIKGFMKLAARHAAEGENAGEIVRLAHQQVPHGFVFYDLAGLEKHALAAETGLFEIIGPIGNADLKQHNPLGIFREFLKPERERLRIRFAE